MKVTVYYGKLGLPDWVTEEDLYYDWCSYLVIEDGDYHAIYSDKMEPEDATFCRDLKWVAKEIENAYNRGFTDGITST